MNFYIVDDDRTMINLLKKIIIENKLGKILGFSLNGQDAIEKISRLNPDIVLVDLLLPRIDGINIVSKLKSMGVDSSFIMISQVTSKDMISKSYEEGIEFFISKPINAIEVISVINRVRKSISMSQIIESFDNAFRSINSYKNEIEKNSPSFETEVLRNHVENLFARLGIVGEAGSKDILEIILLFYEQYNFNLRITKQYKLSEIYEQLNEKYIREYKIDSSIWAIEQRIRRTINKALSNIANLGVVDYGNEAFNMFSSTLFDFKEVRKEMDYIRNKTYAGGKISVKRFIEGIIVFIKSEY